MGLRQRKKPRWTLDSLEIKEHIESGRDMIWESQNGSQKKVKDLDHNHLKNIIQKFNRDGYDWTFDNSVQECLKVELIYRDLKTQQDKDEERIDKEWRDSVQGF